MAKQITQEQIDKIIERLNERVNKANSVFLKNIGKSLDEIRKLTPAEAHKLVQILKYGDRYDKVIKELNKYTKINIDEIDKIFETYAKNDQMFYEQFYKYKDIPFVEYKDNAFIKTQTEAISNLIKNQMYNYTRDNVLGYSITDNLGRLRFTGLREVYNQVLETALLNVEQGKETFDNAMSGILKDIGQSGLKTIQYESGRSIRLDSAIRMHLKDGLTQVHNENQKIFGREFNADGYEISVHLFPAPDHELVQGRQFSIAEYDILNNGGLAKDYKGNEYTLDHDNKNGYRPISTMNCYHYIYPIILGVSKPEYSDEQLEQIRKDNDKGFELDGKHYTNYAGTQLLRKIELELRKQKDIQILAKESNNEELAGETQRKITILTNKYKEVSDKGNLSTRMERLRVSGYNRSATSTKAYNEAINRYKVGEFNISNYTNEIKATTNDVVLLPDRKNHIYERHKDVIPYIDRLPEIINNPDNVYLELTRKKKNTLWLYKTIDDKEIKVTIKLNTTDSIGKELGYKNSIIQMQGMKKKRIDNKVDKGELKELFDITKKKR